MADQRGNKQNPETESIISRCGSISGETFVSLRSRRNCPSGRAPHKLDLLAKNLREYHSQTGLPPDNLSCCENRQPDGRKRINSCFHYYRFIIAMMGGMSVGLMMFHRYSMTIAILRMVNQTHLYLEEHPDRTYQDFLDEGYLPGGEFLWNNEVSIEAPRIHEVSLIIKLAHLSSRATISTQHFADSFHPGGYARASRHRRTT
jgi:hypothetical protein